MNEIIRDNSTVDDMDSFYYNLKYIVERYLMDGAIYCVNVSSSTRMKIKVSVMRLYGNDNISSSRLGKAVPSDSNATELNTININNGHNEVIKYINLLDDAMIEIIQLIQSDSFIRFTHTDQFKKLKFYH